MPHDPRDVLTLADERELLKKQLDVAKEQVRESDKQARRVPGLESELARVRQERDRALEKVKGLVGENGTLDQRVRDLKAELRGEDELHEARTAALAERDAANDAAEEAEADLKLAHDTINRQADTMKEQQEEIDRLREIERSASIHIATGDTLRKHLGRS
jgi:chromosome segregation ATPase